MRRRVLPSETPDFDSTRSVSVMAFDKSLVSTLKLSGKDLFGLKYSNKNLIFSFELRSDVSNPRSLSFSLKL